MVLKEECKAKEKVRERECMHEKIRKPKEKLCERGGMRERRNA